VRRSNPWDRDRVIVALQDRREQEQPLNVGAVQKSDHRLANAIRHHFPSHDEALRAAGVDPAGVRLIVPWDRATVIAELQSRRDLGQPLSKRHVGKLYRAASQAFGTYVKALEAAGIDSREARARTCRIGHWTEELVFNTLRDLHRAGKDLRHRHMKERNQPLFFAAKQLFGSYVNAIKQAGINYWEMSQATGEGTDGQERAGNGWRLKNPSRRLVPLPRAP
jgi:hypothetical protein